MTDFELFSLLKPQFLEIVYYGQQFPESFKLASFPKYYVSTIKDKDIYDVPLSVIEQNESYRKAVDDMISKGVYVGLAFKHSGDGVYVIDEDGKMITPYARDEEYIWVRKQKFFIVCPQGDRFYIVGWDFKPVAPFYENILTLQYKLNAVPCKLACFQPEQK